MMKKSIIFAASLSFASVNAPRLVADEGESSEVAPDNSARNKILNQGTTAQEQSNAKEDLELVARVRRAIINDKALSVNGHNVKIIASAGAVSLKGPVKNAEEREKIVELARKVTGVTIVQNGLEVIR